MESLCIVVPKKKAEPVRKRLVEKGVLRKGLQIKSDAKNVYFPVSQRVDLGYPLETVEFKETEEQVSDYRVLVDVPDDMRALLPSSYDTVGSIAVVKMDDAVVKYAKEIGEAIMATQKAITTVCMDSGVVEQFRTRNIKVVAGENKTETVHKEYGVTLKVDLGRVFFSPRLATERDIVSRQVAPGEVVVDMFAGVGPFSIMIAKTRAPKAVYSIDMNPEAIELMKENIRLNKAHAVHPVLGDARDEIVKLEKADRIIMNLPHDADKFLPDAIRSLKPGGVIHYYEIMEEPRVRQRLEEISAIAILEGCVARELGRRKVKSYSPTLNFYAFDLQFV